jgi:hypothetical protein
MHPVIDASVDGFTPSLCEQVSFGSVPLDPPRSNCTTQLRTTVDIWSLSPAQMPSD